MAFLDMNMQWKVEKGTFLAEVGSSSQDIRLKDQYKVIEDGWLEGKDRASMQMLIRRQTEHETTFKDT